MIFKATITENSVKNGVSKQILKGNSYMPAVDAEDAKRRFCSREASRFLDGIGNEKIRKLKIDYPSMIKVEYVTGEKLVVSIQNVEKDVF